MKQLNTYIVEKRKDFRVHRLDFIQKMLNTKLNLTTSGVNEKMTFAKKYSFKGQIQPEPVFRLKHL